MKLPLIALATILLTGCFSSGPEPADFEKALNKQLQKSGMDISVKATVNAQEGNGSEVSPVYESRITIDVILNEDLYKAKGYPIDGTSIIRKVSSKGDTSRVAGISVSTLENELWVSDISKLKRVGDDFKAGKPISNWDKYVISGTPEAIKLVEDKRIADKAKREKYAAERKAEQERMAAELKQRNDDARKYYSGTWQSEFMTYRKKNRNKLKLTVKIPKGTELTGLAEMTLTYYKTATNTSSVSHQAKYSIEDGYLYIYENSKREKINGWRTGRDKWGFSPTPKDKNKVYGYVWNNSRDKDRSARHDDELYMTKK